MDKKYLFIKCPFCKKELRFEKEPKNRRVHTVCKNCNKEIEIIVK